MYFISRQRTCHIWPDAPFPIPFLFSSDMFPFQADSENKYVFTNSFTFYAHIKGLRDSSKIDLRCWSWCCHFLSVWQLVVDVILAFGPWVGLGLRRLSTLSDLSFFYKIGWVFYKFAENWSILKVGFYWQNE